MCIKTLQGCLTTYLPRIMIWVLPHANPQQRRKSHRGPVDTTTTQPMSQTWTGLQPIWDYRMVIYTNERVNSMQGSDRQYFLANKNWRWLCAPHSVPDRKVNKLQIAPRRRFQDQDLQGYPGFDGTKVVAQMNCSRWLNTWNNSFPSRQSS